MAKTKKVKYQEATERNLKKLNGRVEKVVALYENGVTDNNRDVILREVKVRTGIHLSDNTHNETILKEIMKKAGEFLGDGKHRSITMN